MNKTTIQVVSDIHVDHLAKQKFFIKPKAPTLILCGDIADSFRVGSAAIKSIQQDFNDIIIVLGNHDFYDRELSPTIYLNGIMSRWKQEFDNSNVHVLNNEFISVDGVMYYGGTGWGYPEESPYINFKSYEDFDSIFMSSGSKINIKDMRNLNMGFVSSAGTGPEEADVIISHHLPDKVVLAEQYKAHPLNSLFVGNYRHIASQLKARYWFFGHAHTKTDKHISGCHFVANPFGYYGGIDLMPEIPTKLMTIFSK